MKKYDNDEIEEALREATQTYIRACKLENASDADLRLIGGELTAQEIRTVRAFVQYILGGNSK